MFCGCPTAFGAAAEQRGLPGVPRPARLAAGDQPGRDRVHDPDRPGAELLDRHLVPVRPEELLLPGHAEGLPDLAVRRAAVHRRLPGRRGRGRELPGRHRAGAPGGGHRQVAARRRRHRPDPRRRLLAGRLQPGRHPAGRGRHQAGRRHRRSSRRRSPARTSPSCATCCVRSECPTCGWKRGRCAATSTRRSRRRGAGVGHPDRDQERELAALGGARGAVRDRTAGWRARRGRRDRPGDPALPRGQRHHDLRSEQGRGAGLPLLPRARPGAGRSAARLGRVAAGRAA